MDRESVTLRSERGSGRSASYATRMLISTGCCDATSAEYDVSQTVQRGCSVLPNDEDSIDNTAL